jgi:NAD(P)-dependent dehydrogenase (short-subunit alcohol dehydrogenase family)
MRRVGSGHNYHVQYTAGYAPSQNSQYLAERAYPVAEPTHSYAHLLAKEGITVNAIAPALVETEMVTSNPNAKPDLIPVGRFGSVEETADVAVLLARNGYLTGQTINVNGGWYMS